MSNPNDNDEFKKLEKIWYDKLKQTGFEDIESTTETCDPIAGTQRPLKASHNIRFRIKDQLQLKAKADYYILALALLNTYKFKNATHRRIWQLHCQGLSHREIAKAIAHYKKTYKRESILNIINKIAKEIK